MKPSIGRIVHYQQGGSCRAAIITGVGADSVWLTVFPGGIDLSPVGHDEAKSNGTWHWPERVEG